jgi:hypothetical protein
VPTYLEEIDPGFVSSDVEVIFKQSLCLEPQLGKIVTSIISKEQQSTRFQHLCHSVSNPFNL